MNTSVAKFGEDKREKYSDNLFRTVATLVGFGDDSMTPLELA